MNYAIGVAYDMVSRLKVEAEIEREKALDVETAKREEETVDRLLEDICAAIIAYDK